VTDANGCTGTNSYIITEPPLLTATLAGSIYAGGWGVSCNGACDDTLTTTPSGGTPPFSYTWSNAGPNSPTQTGICAGTYTVTVTDANNCTATASFTVTEPPVLSVSLSGSIYIGGWGVSCNGACDDTLTSSASGGTPPYSYTWSNGGPNAPSQTGICAGTYTVTVTDANGCTATASFIVTEPPVLVVTLSSSIYAGGWGVSCNGACDDTLTSSSSGGTSPYNYTWSNGGPNAPSQTGICAGTYTVTVTDANNCTATASIIVTEPPPLTASLTGSVFAGGWGVSCNGACDDTLSAAASGGTSPYSYSWSNGGPNNSNQTGICAGTYTVTVTDANNCTATASFVVTEPPPLSISITDTLLNPPYHNSCPGSCDTWLVANASGGTTPYNYLWSNGDAGTVADSLCGGVYTVTVTDANGCTLTATFTITDPAQPQAVAGPDQDICANATSLTANVPLPFYSHFWYVVSGSATFSPDSLSNNIQVTNLSWGTNIFVWYVGDTMCIARDTVIVQATQPVTADAGFYPNICEGDEPIHLQANTNYTGVGTWTALPVGSSPIIFNNPNDPNTFAQNFGWNSNTIVWTVVDGPCSATDTVQIVKLIPEVCDSTLLEMPTGFSPNQDGDNDHFVIHGIEFSFNRQNKFIVFNRWGNEVYSKENYLNEWYGQNKDGGLLTDGTYFVILTITNRGRNQGRVLKGYVDMRR
jgi:gliding motility-associated-like protein